MQSANGRLPGVEEFQTRKLKRKEYSKPLLKSLGQVTEITNGTFGSVADITGPGTRPGNNPGGGPG